MLARDLRADLGTVVTLGEAILRREGSPSRQAHQAAAHDAIALLSQYACESRAPGAGAAPAKRAGQA